MQRHLPDEGSLAFFLIHIVVTFISLAIRIRKHSVAVHLVIFPAAVVHTSVLPPVLSCAVHVVLFEIALVGISTGPSESTRALLCTISVGSFKLRAIRPVFEPLSVLLVIFPETSVITTIAVQVVAKAMSFVILELALIDVSFYMDQAAILAS